MRFIVHAIDSENGTELRKVHRDAHIAHIKMKSAMTIEVSGPLLDDEGVARGSIMIVNAPDKKTVQDWVDAEPYNKYGVRASVKVTGFRWDIGSPD